MIRSTFDNIVGLLTNFNIQNKKKLDGCYFAEQKRINGKETALIKVSTSKNGDKEIIRMSGADNLYDNGCHQFEIATYSFNANSHQFGIGDNVFYRWNGSLVVESKSSGFFGEELQNAQVFVNNGNYIKRYIYRDYMFKGIFGGYWFANKDVHVWKKVPDGRCKCCI